ncbi:MAG: hypothetical protein ACLFTQ_01830 [Candidatus Aenigmatarchaeota archaeon]
MDKEISKTELGVLVPIVVLVVIAFLFVFMQRWAQEIQGQYFLVELLLSVLIVVELASLAIKVKNN